MKKLLCLFLCAALCLGCFAACEEVEEVISDVVSMNQGTKDTEETETEAPPETEPAEPVPTFEFKYMPESLGFSDFDNMLVDYLKLHGFADKSFTVSPLSYRAALALAALGAEGETQRQLLAAMGFQSVNEMTVWYASVLRGVDAFDAYFENDPNIERGGAAYEVVNSVWKNEDLSGTFNEEYLARAEELMRASCHSETADALTDAVNQWVSQKTNGLIPAVVSDVSDAAAILVNAIYLKTAWETSFGKIGTDIFTTKSGDKVDKAYMRITDRFRYYEDGETQLVSVPLQGKLSMIFVLGSESGLAGKLNSASWQRVEVTVPMFDVETSLDQHELCDFLISMGCAKPLTGEAEFRTMFSEGLYISDIVQKAKVHVDENGLEAAAATAVVMFGSTAVPAEPMIFRADRPFSFYIINGDASPQLLFWGQIVD